MPNQKKLKNEIHIKIYVKPYSSKNQLIHKDSQWIFYTKEKPIEGRVNKLLIKYLCKKFKVSAKDVSILRGTKNKHKKYIKNT